MEISRREFLTISGASVTIPFIPSFVLAKSSKISYAYKIVNTEYGIYTSYTPGGQRLGETEYILGKKVKAKIGKLFVFDSYDNLNNMYPYLSSYETRMNAKVFKCIVENAEKPKGTNIVGHLKYKDLKQFWFDPVVFCEKAYPVYIESFPVGTLVCDSITLLEEINEL